MQKESKESTRVSFCAISPPSDVCPSADTHILCHVSTIYCKSASGQAGGLTSSDEATAEGHGGEASEASPFATPLWPLSTHEKGPLTAAGPSHSQPLSLLTAALALCPSEEEEGVPSDNTANGERTGHSTLVLPPKISPPIASLLTGDAAIESHGDDEGEADTSDSPIRADGTVFRILPLTGDLQYYITDFESPHLRSITAPMPAGGAHRCPLSAAGDPLHRHIFLDDEAKAVALVNDRLYRVRTIPPPPRRVTPRVDNIVVDAAVDDDAEGAPPPTKYACVDGPHATKGSRGASPAASPSTSPFQRLRDANDHFWRAASGVSSLSSGRSRHQSSAADAYSSQPSTPSTGDAAAFAMGISPFMFLSPSAALHCAVTTCGNPIASVTAVDIGAAGRQIYASFGACGAMCLPAPMPNALPHDPYLGLDDEGVPTSDDCPAGALGLFGFINPSPASADDEGPTWPQAPGVGRDCGEDYGAHCPPLTPSLALPWPAPLKPLGSVPSHSEAAVKSGLSCMALTPALGVSASAECSPNAAVYGTAQESPMEGMQYDECGVVNGKANCFGGRLALSLFVPESTALAYFPPYGVFDSSDGCMPGSGSELPSCGTNDAAFAAYCEASETQAPQRAAEYANARELEEF